MLSCRAKSRHVASDIQSFLGRRGFTICQADASPPLSSMAAAMTVTREGETDLCRELLSNMFESKNNSELPGSERRKLGSLPQGPQCPIMNAAPASVLQDVFAVQCGDKNAQQRVINQMMADGVSSYVISPQKPKRALALELSRRFRATARGACASTLPVNHA